MKILLYFDNVPENCYNMRLYNQLKSCDEYIKKQKLKSYNNILQEMKKDLYDEKEIKNFEENIKDFEKDIIIKIDVPNIYKHLKFKCEKYIKIK